MVRLKKLRFKEFYSRIRRAVLCCLLIGGFVKVNAQVLVVDDNHVPVPFVQVFSNHRYFYVQSGLDGVVEWDRIQKLDDEDSLFFHHIAFETEGLKKGSLAQHDTLVLNKKIYELTEFVVEDERNEGKYEQLSACFRSVQWNNDSTVFYTDGKADYLAKTGKDKYKIHKKEYRSLLDKEYLENRKQRPIDLLFVVAGPRTPPLEYFPDRFIKKHRLVNVAVDSSVFDLMDRNGNRVGRIEMDAHQISCSLNDIYAIKSRHGFNTEVQILKVDVTLIFRRIGGQDWQTATSMQNLLYSKVARVFRVKHDKEQQYMKVRGVSELFIESVWHTNDPSTEDFEFRYGFPKESNYNVEFWKDCDCDLYTRPNPQVVLGLDEQ